MLAIKKLLVLPGVISPITKYELPFNIVDDIKMLGLQYASNIEADKIYIFYGNGKYFLFNEKGDLLELLMVQAFDS